MTMANEYGNAKAYDKSNIAEIIRDNINTLCREQKCKKKTIAKLCQVSETLVSKWTAKKNPVLPSVDMLLTIASYFQVDIQRLVTRHDEYKLPELAKTYSSAFSVLVSLLKKEIIITVDAIQDPILQYLLIRYNKLVSDGIRQEDIDKWLKKVDEEFDIPIGKFHNDETIQFEILHNETGIAVVDEDIKYSNLARALDNDEIVKRAQKRVRDKITNDSSFKKEHDEE